MFEYFDQNNIREYGWENNGHFNSKGYFVMGDVIFEKLVPYFKEKSFSINEVAKNI